MGLNQFAKISPVVNSNGYLLEKDENGNYAITSTVKLKENETGICIDDSSIVVMFEGKPLKLRGGVFQTTSDAIEYVNKNDGRFDGQLLVISDNPTQLYTIVGNQLYNVTENTTKTLCVEIPSEPINGNIFNIIKNSVMHETNQEGYSNGRYLINSIDINIPGINYMFANENDDQIIYPAIIFEGSNSDINYVIEISESSYDNMTHCIVNKEFEGELKILLNASKFDEKSGNIITRYDGEPISVIITYTPIN